MIKNLWDLFLWMIKFLTKFFMQSLWFDYSFWKKNGFFEHGKMNESNYAKKIFYKHYDISKQYITSKLTAIEIGPGDDLSSATFFNNEEFIQFFFIDKGYYASPSRGYKKQYLTEGVNSFNIIDDRSVSYIFANSVFQHISSKELNKYLEEINRVLVRGGVLSLVLDFKDMIDESLFMHLVPDWIWNSRLINNKLFYTNKLLSHEYEIFFKSFGLEIVYKSPSYFTNKSHVSFIQRFANKNESSLLISGCHYVLKLKDL